MKKILIVEDDPIIAHIYKTRLEKEDYEVEIAADGQSGFYRIHEFEPDAVLLDLMLPKMNGVEILKKIRAESKFKRTPVIVFTNAYVPNMINESFLAGATLVFNKATLTPRQIIDSLHSVIYLSGHPSDGTPPKAIAEPAPAQIPVGDQGILAAAGNEESFHSAPRSFSSADGLVVGQTDGPAAPATDASPENEREDAEYQRGLLQTLLAPTADMLDGFRHPTPH